MRPLNARRSPPTGSLVRVRAPEVRVGAHLVARAGSRPAVCVGQRWPFASAGLMGVTSSWSVAGCDSVKRKVVPTGALLAAIAVGVRETAKRSWVRLTAESTGSGGAIVKGMTALTAAIPDPSVTVNVMFAAPGVVGVPVIWPLAGLIE